MVSEAQASTIKAYDAIAPLYAEYSDKYRAYLDAVDDMVIKRLSSGMRMLDIGSGDGRRLHKIALAHGLTDVVAVEPSGKMASLCRQATGFPVHQLFADELGQLPDTQFDVITALWNVFGHMANSQTRLSALTLIRQKLAPTGSIILDVNNRHNRLAYGHWNVLKRRILDVIAFDETRGDAHYHWKIGNESFPATGHLFTPSEIINLFERAGLKAVECLTVNYKSGAVSTSPFDGQLFFRLQHNTNRSL